MDKSTRYNIFFLLNDKYLQFGKILVNSIYNNCNLNKINKILIVDIGLSNKTLDYLNKYDKIHIIKYETKQNLNKGNIVHSKEWKTAVSIKTKSLLQQVKIMKHPIVMIDVDCVVIEDFSDSIDKKYDIQVSKREKSMAQRFKTKRKANAYGIYCSFCGC